ncbi:pyridoxamine 5'-phosphate oxidase family protein [Neolewinella aurantiaca]|uniref:Pyridoxamine 5'-phosphate oxidase family protein n=1 Tax=Neolewinella aurantiaca TaxID=2602767 RepID=A0A5C7FE41_9BACT|nr:pyridoxamine 5'-phosphate oxidase family protein [Neolewinella aurantiaca]TXF88508.1 pyridoxamine 5'-phosphate oxidase family protein [Neolewinella aurantiaca]
MSTTKNLFNEEAVAKIKNLADGGFVMLCTDLDSKPFSSCPMSVQQVDDQGNLWFFSGKDSDHNADIRNAPATQVLLANSSDSDYLSLYGKSTITEDRSKIEELWSPAVKTWFQEGKDDPNLSLIRFTPDEGFYWDTKNGKMVAMAKMMASVVTGKTMDDDVEGTLKV